MILDIFTRVIQDNDFKALRQLDIEILYEDEKEFYEFLTQYFIDYGSLPDTERCSKANPSYTLFIISKPNKSPINDLIDQFSADRVFEISQKKFTEQSASYNARKTYDFSDLTAFISKKSGRKTVKDSVLNIADFDRAKHYQTQVANAIPIGLDVVDDYGGLRPGSFIVFAAKMKTLKSTLLTSIATRLYMGGFNVLFINNEMANTELVEKVDAFLGGFDSNVFLKNNQNDYRTLLEKLPIVEYKHKRAEKLGGNYFLMPEKVYSVSELNNMLLYFGNNGTPIDFLFIDGIQYVSHEGKPGFVDYNSMDVVTVGLRDLSKNSNVRFIGSTHFKAHLTDKLDWASTDVAYSTKIGNFVTQLLSIGTDINTPVLNGRNRYYIRMMENRFGSSSRNAASLSILEVDFRTSSMYNSSTVSNNDNLLNQIIVRDGRIISEEQLEDEL